MSQNLDGTVALVTGASSGIGAATAVALARLGVRVALVARRKDRLEAVAEEIATGGGTALSVMADITDATQAADAVRQVNETFGQIDVLVNNAGLMLLGSVEGAPLEEWDRMIAINLQGLLYVTHSALPHLLSAAAKRGRADIVNVSSVAGRNVRPGMGVYNLTKHGVGAFSEALRQEISDRHVRVSLIEPGPVGTELFSHIRKEVMPALSGSIGNGLLAPEDVAETIAFVVSRPARVVVNEVLLRPDASVL